jgi:uncharacterized membrane protein
LIIRSALGITATIPIGAWITKWCLNDSGIEQGILESLWDL